MNKKGFTLVELLVSIVLISTIAYFLFQIIFVIRDIYVDRNIKSEVYIETSNISNIINKDILSKQKDDISLSRVFKVNNDEIDMVYSNNELMIIKINRDTNTISYANYSVDISKDVNIGNIELYYNYDNTSLEKNGVLYIKIPITKNKTDFSIVILARYDSTKLSTNATHLVEAEEETCEYENGYVWNFDYTGDVQSFTVPCNGTYKVELWGSGAGISTSASFRSPGQGGYTKGDINLNKNSNIYLYVGGMSGYNSGAMGASNGGGATDVRYFENTPSTNELIWNSNSGLNSRIMVAAGGGGGFVGEDTVKAIGHAGGLIGYAASTQSHNQYSGAGGSQVSGGAGGTNYCHSDWTPCDFSNKNGSFGLGGYVTIRDGNTYHSSGGGGGYYGGGVGPHWGAGTPGGGGGSSYISGHAGCLAIDGTSTSNPRTLKSGCTTSSTSVDCSTHYSGLKFTDTVMIDGAGYNWTTTKGSQVGMPKYDGTDGTMTGNSGDGYARITLVSSGNNTNLNEINLNLSGRTLGTPSNTASANTTKRTWNVNTYAVGLSGDNYYTQSYISNYSVSADSITIASGCGYGLVIPLTLEQNKTYSVTPQVTPMYYTSDGTFGGTVSVTNVGDYNHFTVPANAEYILLHYTGGGACSTEGSKQSKTYSNIHLYKLD